MQHFVGDSIDEFLGCKFINGGLVVSIQITIDRNVVEEVRHTR